MSSADEIAAGIARKAKEQIDQTIEVPSGLNEDQAVDWTINYIKDQTGYEPPDAEVRAEVREQMQGRATT
jgi:hypothetical protein